MRRILFIFLCAWTLLLGPSLCEAGWIAHFCLDHSTADCGHEEDCYEDPCASSALRPVSSHEEFGTLSSIADAAQAFAMLLPDLAEAPALSSLTFPAPPSPLSTFSTPLRL